MEAAGRGRDQGLDVGVVRAAGGIPWRETADGIEVLLVHRPKYDDWTFPKGKCERPESDEECALREVREETGLRCTLGPELRSTSYADAKGRPKTVRYWALRVLQDEARPQHEVDRVEWLSPEEAHARLSYDRDREVLASLART